ncbi:Retrovirus-related Pol polyprotein from transposon TNT 1-94 [Vitis vinifera]|uniref:Retrovirus-related Pol polyprotein from transposon TNT 1-94 n=1 Tax=Vitis vinifera TaxID=29760 RepID=A0A438IR22_VITVI|nr:Retrovirus-related Pol polyprotein from transposon TNT 1-94 [Vitis vinifera]
MDVKTTFLNGDLEEEIYMDQVEGCVAPDKEKKVYNLEVVCETKRFLGSKFDMKDLGETKVILGIKITRTPNGLKLSQEHYVEKILRKFEHFDYKSASTPYDPSSQLKKNREYSVAQIEYAQIIGSLMYLKNHTRPAIAYVVSRLSRGFPNVLEGFSDANWILDSDEMESTSGYVFILCGSAVSWKLAPSMSMCCDSQIAIAKTKSKIFNGKNRHISLRHNIARQLLESGVISLEFVRLELNLVDHLTKPLNKKLVEETSNGMGLMPIAKVKSGDRAYSALTKVECLLLMNTIFLMNRPQALPTLLKAIACRKGIYPNLIVHSPKRPRRTQGELMDATPNNTPGVRTRDLGSDTTYRTSDATNSPISNCL